MYYFFIMFREQLRADYPFIPSFIHLFYFLRSRSFWILLQIVAKSNLNLEWLTYPYASKLMFITFICRL